MISKTKSFIPKNFSEYFAGVGKYHLVVFLCCWLGGIFDGMDSTLMSVVLPSAIQELLHSSSKVLISKIGSYVTAIFLLGWTVGGLTFGYVGDRFGRVKSMIYSILLYAIFTGLSGLAQNWEQLAFCRFMTGLGIGGELVSIATFISEVWPQRSKTFAIGALITSYQAGVFLSGAVSFMMGDWRRAFFVGALPALLVIALRLGLKESDKWLQGIHQHSSKDSLKKEDSFFKTLTSKIHRRNLLLGSLAFGGLLVGYWASLSWIPTWIQSIISNPESSSERSLATMIQGVFAIIGCLIAGILCDVLGRKKTLFASFIGCFGASYLLFVTNSGFSNLVYMQVTLLSVFIGMAQATLYIYLPELFPTIIRASGTGFCLNAGRLITIVSVLFISHFVSIFGGYGQAAFVFSFSYLVGVLVSIFALETKHKSLE